MDTVAETIHKAIQGSGCSQLELARSAHVDRNFLCALIVGKRPPRTRTGRRIARDDERYLRLARTLRIDETAFVALVEKEQGVERGACVSSPRRETAELETWPLLWVRLLALLDSRAKPELRHLRALHAFVSGWRGMKSPRATPTIWPTFPPGSSRKRTAAWRVASMMRSMLFRAMSVRGGPTRCTRWR